MYWMIELDDLVSGRYGVDLQSNSGATWKKDVYILLLGAVAARLNGGYAAGEKEYNEECECFHSIELR